MDFLDFEIYYRLYILASSHLSDMIKKLNPLLSSCLILLLALHLSVNEGRCSGVLDFMLWGGQISVCVAELGIVDKEVECYYSHREAELFSELYTYIATMRA